MAKATLDGRPLLDGTVAWRMTAGTTPNQADFEMDRADAERLLNGKLKPITLKIDTPGAKGVKVENLYAIHAMPADTPHTLMVRVVDRRWFFSYVHVNHSFNVRRITGVKRTTSGFNRPVIDRLVPRLKYAPYSVPNTGIWTAETALKKVWETVSKPEQETSGRTPPLVIESDVTKLGEGTLPLEDVEVSDTGDAALKRIMDFIPGAQMTVDHDGTVRVYSIASGKADDILDALDPEQEGGGHAEPVSYRRIRPTEVRIYFAPEAEVKFTFTETNEQSRYAPDPKDHRPTLDNVLPVPDFKLGSWPQGTWLAIPTALNQWGAVPGFGKLTYLSLRRAMVPYLDLWTGVRIAGLADKKNDWASRIAAVTAHFRRTYRINPSAMNLIRSIRAYRVANVDRATGSRGPATAYQDWSVVATQRFLSAQLSGLDEKKSYAYAQNFDSNLGDKGQIGAKTIVAPIDVSIADHDQGILRFEFKSDPYRRHEQFLPSKIDNIPDGRLTGGLVAWNAIHPGQGVPELQANHVTATILTVVPGGPNDKSRLFKMVRNNTDVSELLPSSLAGGISRSDGPPMDVFIGPGWETARIAWSEGDGAKILDALGLVPYTKQKGNVQELANLILNLGKDQGGLGDTAASMDAIANAVAASIYAEHADRPQGTRSAPVTDKAEVRGFIESVIHQVLPDGEASSAVTLTEQPKPLDLMSMMPSSTRAVILKLARKGKQ